MAAAGLALEYASPFDILNRDKTRLAIPDNDGLENAGMKFPLPSVADVSSLTKGPMGDKTFCNSE